MFLNIHTHPFHPFTHRKKSFRDLDTFFMIANQLIL
nr:MAG TPA: protein of unknown function (DUF5372) [Caudoviricetes sp.]